MATVFQHITRKHVTYMHYKLQVSNAYFDICLSSYMQHMVPNLLLYQKMEHTSTIVCLCIYLFIYLPYMN